MSASPVRPKASASNGAVCSLNPSPASNANAVTVPAGFLTRVRLTTAPGWKATRSAARTAPWKSDESWGSLAMGFLACESATESRGCRDISRETSSGGKDEATRSQHEDRGHQSQNTLSLRRGGRRTGGHASRDRPCRGGPGGRAGNHRSLRPAGSDDRRPPEEDGIGRAVVAVSDRNIPRPHRRAG